MKKKEKKHFILLPIIMISIVCMAAIRSGDWVAPAAASKRVNPLKGNAAATAAGKKLYITLCSSCHGNKGKGDGPAAIAINPRPADHTSEKIQKQSDGAIFWKITQGQPPMASYKESLKEEQRWQLVNYIRTLNQ